MRLSRMSLSSSITDICCLELFVDSSLFRFLGGVLWL